MRREGESGSGRVLASKLSRLAVVLAVVVVVVFGSLYNYNKKSTVSEKEKRDEFLSSLLIKWREADRDWEDTGEDAAADNDVAIVLRR